MGGSSAAKYRRGWSLSDSYDFISTYISSSSTRLPAGPPARKHSSISRRRFTTRRSALSTAARPSSPSPFATRPCLYVLSQGGQSPRSRHFHDYFVTHLPQSSLHPDSRSATGPGHKLPRSASIPHTPGQGRSPAAVPPSGGSRELTVVRIPLKSAKHHFGASVARGNRPYQEDRYQAGTIELPAFAKRVPISLSRKPGGITGLGGISADGASGDPQVFYFGVFDGHGGEECSEFLKEDLHGYIEQAAEQFKLGSSLRDTSKTPENDTRNIGGPSTQQPGTGESELSTKGKESLDAVPLVGQQEVKDKILKPEIDARGRLEMPENGPTEEGKEPQWQPANKVRVQDMEKDLVQSWKDTVGGYFRRFKPDHFSIFHNEDSDGQLSIETVLMYAFLKADLDFITAQASKPSADSPKHLDAPLNNDEVFGSPAQTPNKHRIGGATRFTGGSTCSIALISTPTPTPFWHPASPSTLLVAHVGDTRILLCETATGLAVPVTTNHHPSSPIEGTRLRRYAATFVTDSFGEERMSGLANTRAFGDMRSKRIGVSAEPELTRLEMGAAQYSFLVLVSDGVSGTCSDQEVVDIVKEAKTPEQAAKDILSFSTDVTKEGDNATALVVRLGGWERRGEGGTGSLGTKEGRDWRRNDALDPRGRRT